MIEDLEPPFLIIDGIKYRFTSEHTANEVYRILNELADLGVPALKVGKLMSRLIDVVRNDF